MSTTTNTVKFNVGGRHFEVSRDLLEEHSETMLSKLVSEALDNDPEERIFIDRDGDIFAHVLNYLRCGSIKLPTNVPKSSIERDLDFYGIKCNSAAFTDVFSTSVQKVQQQYHDARRLESEQRYKDEMRVKWVFFCIFMAPILVTYAFLILALNDDENDNDAIILVAVFMMSILVMKAAPN